MLKSAFLKLSVSLFVFTMPLSLFAVQMRGIKKNVAMQCESADKKIQVVLLSDVYTTSGYGELQGTPGQIYAVVGGLKQVSSPGFTPAQMIPLSQTSRPGWFDKTLGLYESADFTLDMRSRKHYNIKLRNNRNGEILSCMVFGDCC